MSKNGDNTSKRVSVKHNISESFHLDYFNLAVESCFECQQDSSRKWYLSRHVLDTIIYSYTCIEASIEYLYQMGKDQQLPSFNVPDTWEARFLSRKWGSLSLSDKIGMLSHAWIKQEFWENENQFGLFLNLERIRDKLIHTEIYRFIHIQEIREYEQNDNTLYETKHISIEPKTKDFLRQRNQAIANFHNNPRELNIEDAYKALEITILILMRFEALFNIKDELTQTSFNNTIEYAEDILHKINCNFKQIWEDCQ